MVCGCGGRVFFVTPTSSPLYLFRIALIIKQTTDSKTKNTFLLCSNQVFSGGAKRSSCILPGVRRQSSSDQTSPSKKTIMSTTCRRRRTMSCPNSYTIIPTIFRLLVGLNFLSCVNSTSILEGRYQSSSEVQGILNLAKDTKAMRETSSLDKKLDIYQNVSVRF